MSKPVTNWHPIQGGIYMHQRNHEIDPMFLTENSGLTKKINVPVQFHQFPLNDHHYHYMHRDRLWLSYLISTLLNQAIMVFTL